MKPQKFIESNVVFAENQDEYLSLPALIQNDEYGTVVTCWGLSFKERLNILFKGTIWLSLLTFNKPLQPILLDINKPEMIT